MTRWWAVFLLCAVACGGEPTKSNGSGIPRGLYAKYYGGPGSPYQLERVAVPTSVQSDGPCGSYVGGTLEVLANDSVRYERKVHLGAPGAGTTLTISGSGRIQGELLLRDGLVDTVRWQTEGAAQVLYLSEAFPGTTNCPGLAIAHTRYSQ